MDQSLICSGRDKCKPSMKKIMVVDDERDLLALLKGYLKRAGYDVAVTTTCGEGTAILASFKPDLIFLDINVGTEDGRDMCRQIKSLAEHKHIPIVLISADDDSLQTYKEYSADSYLRKPFLPPQLLKTAASYLFPELRA
jgi:CheY-like chemotaxis protein